MTTSVYSNIKGSSNGKAPIWSLPFSTYTVDWQLNPATLYTVVVPFDSDAYFAYSPGAIVRVRLNATISLPTNAPTVLDALELNPNVRPVLGGDTIYIISPNADHVVINFRIGER